MSDHEFRFHFAGVAGVRLDRYLTDQMADFSRSRIQGLIRDGFVSVNQQITIKSALALDPGMDILVRVPPAQPSGLQAEDISLDVIFENDDLMVVNKPAGMVVHPAAGHELRNPGSCSPGTCTRA